MRVWAVKGTNTASRDASSLPRKPYWVFARITIDRPSGVSSASDESWVPPLFLGSASSSHCSGLLGIAPIVVEQPGIVDVSQPCQLQSRRAADDDQVGSAICRSRGSRLCDRLHLSHIDQGESDHRCTHVLACCAGGLGKIV